MAEETLSVVVDDLRLLSESLPFLTTILFRFCTLHNLLPDLSGFQSFPHGVQKRQDSFRMVGIEPGR
ncbi:hypothetical protein YC2023_058096 [Brassica napus]